MFHQPLLSGELHFCRCVSTFTICSLRMKIYTFLTLSRSTLLMKGICFLYLSSHDKLTTFSASTTIISLTWWAVFSLVTTFNWNSSIKFLYFCLESTWTRIFTLEMWIITKFDILLSQSSKPFAFSLRTLIFSDSSLLSQISEAGFLCLSLLLL